MLEVQHLSVEVSGKTILEDVSLKFESGKVHALMGPNGSGKSTLANVIMGHPKYTIVSGKILLDGKDITTMPVHERAKAGIFLSFQHPQEYEGITIRKFLRTIVNARVGDGKKISVMDFKKVLEDKMHQLGMESSFASRYLNAGFSGGEKKRMEMLQLALLEPQYAFLDETDSGLDVDAIKTVASAIQTIKEKTKMGIILITHYNRFLEYLQPDIVSVIYKGKIILQGGKELAERVEKDGFGGIIHDYKSDYKRTTN